MRFVPADDGHPHSIHAAHAIPSPDVSFLVVTYNSVNEIGACLESISRAAGVPHEALVLDNGSTDATVELIASHHPEVSLYTSEANLGFGAGVNALAARARGRHLVLLNPDAVLHPGAVQALLEIAERRPEGGLYGGRCLTTDGDVNPGSCWGESTLWNDICFATGLSAVFRNHRLFDPHSMGNWPRDTEREVGMVTGCLLLTPTAVWQELGGFDEDYWLYGEDADLSARARGAGYRPVITPAATITHDFGTSSPSDGWRLIKTFTGKATMQYKHHSLARARVGILLLQLGVWLRARPLLMRAPGREQEGTTWAEAWAGRRQWRAGFPPRDAVDATLVAHTGDDRAQDRP